MISGICFTILGGLCASRCMEAYDIYNRTKYIETYTVLEAVGSAAVALAILVGAI